MVCVKMILPLINHGCSVNLNLMYGWLVLVCVIIVIGNHTVTVSNYRHYRVNHLMGYAMQLTGMVQADDLLQLRSLPVPYTLPSAHSIS